MGSHTSPVSGRKDRVAFLAFGHRQPVAGATLWIIFSIKVKSHPAPRTSEAPELTSPRSMGEFIRYRFRYPRWIDIWPGAKKVLNDILASCDDRKQKFNLHLFRTTHRSWILVDTTACRSLPLADVLKIVFRCGALEISSKNRSCVWMRDRFEISLWGKASLERRIHIKIVVNRGVGCHDLYKDHLQKFPIESDCRNWCGWAGSNDAVFNNLTIIVS